MRVFLSYASEQRPLAERTCRVLESEGSEVFFDRDDLKAGDAYGERIRAAMMRSHVIVFFVSRYSIAPGYALTELAIVQSISARRRPRMLPVLTEPLNLETLPPFLKPLSLLEPEGDLSAEVAARVATRSSPKVASEPERRPSLEAPPVEADHAERRPVDAVQAAHVDGDHLAPGGILAPSEGADAAGWTEVVVDPLRVELVVGELIRAGLQVELIGTDEGQARARLRADRTVALHDLLQLDVEFIQKRTSVCKFAGRASVDGKLAAEAQFTAMIADPPAS